MTKGDIHNRQNKINNTLEKIENSEEISEQNKETITGFKDFLESQDLSIDRISRYLYTWNMFAEKLDWQIAEPEKDKIIELVRKIHQDKIKEKDLIPVNCPECSKLNRFESENCKRCGEVLTTSKLYEQAKIKEATDDLVYELAVQEGPFDEEDIKEKAKELVKES